MRLIAWCSFYTDAMVWTLTFLDAVLQGDVDLINAELRAKYHGTDLSSKPSEIALQKMKTIPNLQPGKQPTGGPIASEPSLQQTVAAGFPASPQSTISVNILSSPLPK